MMPVRYEIKAQIVRAGYTIQEVVDRLHEEYDWSDSVSNLSAKLQRESIRYKEVVELADVLTGVPMVADYPSLNLGQAVMVYCYQLATLIQQPAKSDTTADQHQLQALRERAMTLLTTLAVADDIKLVDWLQQRLGLLEQRDTAMLHRLLHDIEKNITK